MISKKFLILAGMAALFSLNCMAVNLTRPHSADTPTVKPTTTPSPAPIPTPELLPPTSEGFSVPAWVTDFANPILAALAGRVPDFKDDFSGHNLGWFYVIPGSRAGPYYARIQDEALLLETTDEAGRGNSMAYNPWLIRRNFVLSLDVRFGKTETKDILRFKFDQSADRSVELDLSRNEKWTIDWNLHNDQQTAAGTYDHFPPERINVVVIMQGNECAVYLDHDPLEYLKDCRPGPMVHSSPLAVSFHLLAARGSGANVVIDNVKLWDLDKIPGLISSQ